MLSLNLYSHSSVLQRFFKTLSELQCCKEVLLPSKSLTVMQQASIAKVCTLLKCQGDLQLSMHGCAGLAICYQKLTLAYIRRTRLQSCKMMIVWSLECQHYQISSLARLNIPAYDQCTFCCKVHVHKVPPDQLPTRSTQHNFLTFKYTRIQSLLCSNVHTNHL